MTDFQTKLFDREAAAWVAVASLIETDSNAKGQTSGAYRDSPEYSEWLSAQEAIDKNFPRKVA